MFASQPWPFRAPKQAESCQSTLCICECGTMVPGEQFRLIIWSYIESYIKDINTHLLKLKIICTLKCQWL